MHTANHRFSYGCLVALILLGALGACTKMDETYKDLVKDGAMIYPARPDSLKAFSGNERIVLSWTVSDPKVNRFKIYWNQRADSMELPVAHIEGLDTMRIPVEGLTEGIYSFTVYSFDVDNHRSVSAEAIGTVYGQQYATTLANRFIENISVVDGSVLVAWSNPDEGAIGEQITYKDADDNIRDLFVPVADTAVLANFAAGDSFRYQTLYLPTSTAVDTFVTDYASASVDAKFFEIALNQSVFSLYPLAGDYSTPNGSANTVDQIWSSEAGARESNTYISKVNGHDLPQWFTIDLGGAYKLTRMKLFQRGDAGHANRLYAGGNLKTFEVWGSIDPDENYNPDDHGGDFGPSWVLLATCNVDRPSGNILPSGSTRSDNSTEDIDAAVSGHEFFFNSVGKVHFIRIKGIETWDSAKRGFINIASIALWKQ